VTVVCQISATPENLRCAGVKTDHVLGSSPVLFILLNNVTKIINDKNLSKENVQTGIRELMKIFFVGGNLDDLP